MFGHRSYRGERLELLRWLLVENDRSGYKSYQFSQFLDGATCVDAAFIAMRFTTNNGHTIHLGNPVTHFQLGRELCYALQYVDDYYPPRFSRPSKVQRRNPLLC